MQGFGANKNLGGNHYDEIMKDSKWNSTVVSLSELTSFNNYTAEFHVLFKETKKRVLNTPKEELWSEISRKSEMIIELLRWSEIEKTNVKYAFSSTNLNIVKSVLLREKSIESVKKEDQLQITTALLFIVEGFNLKERIEKQKEEILKRLKLLERLEKEL